MDQHTLTYAFRNYWAHKGGKFGRCHSHPDANFFWVNIPKNASSWTQTFLAHELLWCEHDYYGQDLRSKKSLVCLRDPVDRWVSGITEFFSLYHPRVDLGQMTDLTQWLLADRIVFDDHTEKQSYFLDGIDLKNSIFFCCNDHYREDFLGFFIEGGHIPRDYVVPECVDAFCHHHKTDSAKKQVYNFFKELVINDSDFRNSIQRYYKADYDLFENIDFYRAASV